MDQMFQVHPAKIKPAGSRALRPVACHKIEQRYRSSFDTGAALLSGACSTSSNKDSVIVDNDTLNTAVRRSADWSSWFRLGRDATSRYDELRNRGQSRAAATLRRGGVQAGPVRQPIDTARRRMAIGTKQRSRRRCRRCFSDACCRQLEIGRAPRGLELAMRTRRD